MKKSLLNLYMQKVASGDLNYLDRLCKQLADRLVFTPITSSSNSGPNKAKTTFSVLRLNDNGNSQVLLFTTEKRFKEWSQKASHQAGSISLLGADFCAALGKETWISLDKGFEEEIVLDPVFVAKVSASTSQFDMHDEVDEVEGDEPPQQPEMEAPAAPSSDRGLARGALFASQPMPEEYVPRSVARAASTTPITLTKEAEEQEEAPPPPSSKLMRSAIFSPEPLPSNPVRHEPQAEAESEPKKKKSFLNFLKGS